MSLQTRSVKGDYFLTITAPAGTIDVADFVFRLGTRTALRNGQWFDGCIVSITEPTETFDLGKLASGERVTVKIATANQSLLAGVVAVYEFTFSALLEIEMLAELASPATLQILKRKQYRYISGTLAPGSVTFVLSSIDDSAINSEYPSATYTAAEYPNIDTATAGKPICFPVGTAVKLPCPLLAQQTLWDGTLRQPEWLYGVCELEWQSYAITAVNTGAKTFGIAGDRTAQLNAGDSIWVFDTSSRSTVTNEGKYTVVSATFSAGTTTITVNETIGSATVACHVNIPPRVLNIYRNGRLVNKTEYTIEVIDNGAGAVPATVGDFSTGATDWSAAAAGTGTATLASGTANITGDGGGVNVGAIGLSPGRGSGVQQRRHQYAPWQITCTGTGAAWLSDTTLGAPIVGNGSLVRAGSPARLLIRRGGASADLRCRLTTTNAGATGTNLTFDDWSIEQPAKPLLMVRFTREQRDPSGALYVIEADVFGYRSRNVADELTRILAAAGRSVDAFSFGPANTYAAANVMLVDCDHGARGKRKVRAILEDLLFIARGCLTKNEFEEYVLTQDRDAASLTAELYESQGDLVAVDSLSAKQLVEAIELRYKPSTVNPQNLLHTLRRSVFGAFGIGVETRDCFYLRDHTAADRLACYLRERALAMRTVRARLILQDVSLGNSIRLHSTGFLAPLSPFTGLVRSARYTRAGIDIDLVEIGAIETYTADTLPTDITEPYEPDYSQTPPAAPSVLRITALAGGRASVDAVPPAVNWAEVWFVITHNTNGQIMGLILGDYSTTTGKASTIIGGLTAGQVYKLQAYAKNTYLLQGTLQSTFDATAIGGGAAVTTFTA